MRNIWMMFMLLISLTACQTTGDKSDDQAAQSFFPSFADYQVDGLAGTQDAVLGALALAGIGTGNIPFSVVMYKLDDFVDCYRETGVFDARLYIERLSNTGGTRLPVVGVLTILNQDRALDNFLPCLVRVPDGLMRAQSGPEPCTGSGTFRSGGNTYSYIYAASDERCVPYGKRTLMD